jgi:hypothetical protein
MRKEERWASKEEKGGDIRRPAGLIAVICRLVSLNKYFISGVTPTEYLVRRAPGGIHVHTRYNT